jgi:uncharacterized membrane protein YfcA
MDLQALLDVMGIGLPGLLLLVGVGFATAILSAIVGMAGGVTLLSVMLLFFDPLVVIPLHGVVQLVSNSSRAVIQRKHLRWDLIGRYAVFILPAGFAGLVVAKQLPPDFIKAMIGCFVLLATWRPKLLLLGSHPEDTDPKRRFLFLGAAVGVLNVIIGATGPIIAPFFLNLRLTRFALIGTKAACQAAGHISKVVIFATTGFVFGDYWLLLVLLSITAIAGTWTGSRLLEYVNETWFIRMYMTVLTLIALHLIWVGILPNGG